MLQLLDGLKLLPYELIHPSPLVVLSGPFYGLVLFSSHSPHLSLLLAVHKPPKISYPSLNGLYAFGNTMNVLADLIVPLSLTSYLHLEVRERLEESEVK